MTFPCMFHLFTHVYYIFDTLYSRNITIKNSPGFIRRDEPAYTSIPPDSRKPPAPIDPSGKPSLSL